MLLKKAKLSLSDKDFAALIEELDTLDVDPLEQDDVTAALKAIPTYQNLQAALILNVAEQHADIVLKDGSTGVIDWPGMSWARPYVDDKTQGRAPKLAEQIVHQGEVVYVKATDTQFYRLSQLPDVSGALVAISPDTGAILASVGGFSFKQSQFDRITQANRQVGSNIKPFVYSSALENGYSLASIVNDAPINQWDKRSGFAWRPKNSPAVYEGPLRVRTGLAKSKNVVSVRLLRGIGINTLISHLGKFGFDEKTLPKNESLALGSASLTPLQVVTGYSAFANGATK